MKILTLTTLSIAGALTSFASDEMGKIGSNLYEYEYKAHSISSKINLDIPLQQAINSLKSSQERYRGLSLKITVDFPPMGIATNMESFKKLQKIGIEQIFFEIKIEGNILSIPRWLIDKGITDQSDEYCDLAIENLIPRYIP